MTNHVLCLNPAIDKIYEIDGFTAGEDYPGQRPGIQIGGKGVNVARVLSQLGENVRLYAFLGESGADDFRREMQNRCACSFITVPGACRTTVNIIDRRNARETVITEAGPAVSDQHIMQLLALLETYVEKGDIVCCCGSVIAGAPADIYARTARICEAKGAKCVLDCNAKALPASIQNARYVLGKPNERELCALLGRERTQEPEKIVQMARELMPPYDALLVSMGAQGGMWIDASGAYLARVPRRTVISTVGSGDAALAGAVSALAQGKNAQDALRTAMACGVANAMRKETGSVRRADVLQAETEIEIIKL